MHNINHHNHHYYHINIYFKANTPKYLILKLKTF